MNFSPIGLNMGRLYPYKKWAWLPKELEEDGYSTALFTANPAIPAMDLALDGIFSRSITQLEALKYEGDTSVEAIVGDAIEFLDKHSPAFVFLLLMETHTPMYDGEKVKVPFPVQRPSSVFDFQRRAIEYIDGALKPLFDVLKERSHEIIVTSDHGELLGPVKWGHNPSDLTLFRKSMIKFDETLFEIPFIKGKVR